jgi:hypothetical protein
MDRIDTAVRVTSGWWKRTVVAADDDDPDALVFVETDRADPRHSLGAGGK